MLIGLGARDSLRIEAGLCLYGSDIDESTTPVEAGLEWAIQKVRRLSGARAGNFPGADMVLEQIERGAPRYRVGVEAAPAYACARRSFAVRRCLHISIRRHNYIRHLRSFGGGPVAMGYVLSSLSAQKTLLFADVRGNRLPVEVTELPFVPHRYKRT